MSFPPSSRCARNQPRSNRGSAILTALVLAAVTAVVAANFLVRASQESRLATRSYFQSVAVHLAEAGIEEGLYAANSSGFTSAAGWYRISGTTADYAKSITSGFNFVQGQGEMYVRVDSATTPAPVITATGVVRIPGQPPLLKQLRIGTAKRRLWGNGIVVKGSLTFSGHVLVDSYDSQLGPYDSATNSSDAATVATSSTSLDPLLVGSNAVIRGYVATGGAEPIIGNGGSIYGATTPSGTLVDASRIRRDFTANLPDATAPSGTAVALGAITTSLTLPLAGDLPGPNGRYLYEATHVALGGTEVVAAQAPVDLIVTGNLSMTGSTAIQIAGAAAANPSLHIYCPGDVVITGNGVANTTNSPAAFSIWGTAASPATQSITAGGNGTFTGTIYAPNANITLSGNSGTCGAIIGKNATVSGNSEFHYDIRLGGIPVFEAYLRPISWCELTGAPGTTTPFARDNRAPFAALF